MCTIELSDSNGRKCRIDLVDPEEHKRQVADYQAHCRREPGSGAIVDLGVGSSSKPESSARGLPTHLNRGVPFPNRVIKHSQKSNTPKARLVSRLAHHFRKRESQSSKMIAGPEYEMDLDEIY